MPAEKYNNLSDEELLSLYYKEGDSEWLGILLQRYTLLLYGVAMKYLKNDAEAQDAVQQVFLKTITVLKRYKVTYFKTWLYTVVKNHCLLLIRNKTNTSPIGEEFPIDAEETDFLLLQHNEKTLSAIENCLQKLNKEQGTCLTLFYLQKKSYQEVSNLTNYSLLEVKSYIQNGKRNLKIMVENHLKQ